MLLKIDNKLLSRKAPTSWLSICSCTTGSLVLSCATFTDSRHGERICMCSHLITLEEGLCLLTKTFTDSCHGERICRCQHLTALEAGLWKMTNSGSLCADVLKIQGSGEAKQGKGPFLQSKLPSILSRSYSRFAHEASCHRFRKEALPDTRFTPQREALR
jgi:hypothetical protein